ncbi:glycosyltransferase, partial [Ruegeria sp.]|uniref:glycosyltransferase n=1 Tax=Ruegeria sp. TaxID=1879320 RepID=UPI002326EDD8
SCNVELFRDCHWHDQDLVRVIRAQDPHLFRLFDEGEVLHLCNGGQTLIDERSPQEFYHKKTGAKPCIVHFAGGAWKPYASIAPSYTVNDNAYFFIEEQTERYDAIRKLSDYDPFDAQSEFFSEHNATSKIASRDRWMKLTADRDKKRMLFCSWLDTGSHRPLRHKLADFLGDETFDLAIIDGNVKAKDHEGLVVEDLPDLLTQVTRTVRNDRFGRQFGYVRDDVPEEAIEGAIAALVKEYNCSQRNARAVANAAYIYFSKAIAFYKPDVVVGWAIYQSGTRVLKQICKARGIPFITMEFGVLPETLLFDCLGHMGESWVAQHSDDFNKLPLDDGDKQAARDYLQKVRQDRPSRNVKVDLAATTASRLERLKKSGKKIVVYIGSNCASSGHVPYDAAARKHHSPFFRDNDDVVRNLSKAFEGNKDIHLIYKPHPISITRGLDLADEYPGITVMADVNLDDCLAIADLAVVKVSQSNYEAILRDVPVLMVGRNQLSGSGAAYELGDKDALKVEVLNALETGVTQAQKAAFDDHVARLLKYYLYAISGTNNGRPQSQVTKDIAAMLDQAGPEHLNAEQNALHANPNPEPMIGDTPALSVIMPVYNGQRYLADSIGAVLSQTFGDFELICVNNGSTDASQDILDYFAARDPRIRLFNLDVADQGAARNLGTNQARGHYLHFMDCDDLLIPTAYEELISAMETSQAEILYFFYAELIGTPTPTRPRYREFRNYLPLQQLFKVEDRHQPLFAQYPFTWAKLFRADFFRQHALFFDTDCENFEDNPQNLRSLLASQNAHVLNRPLYRYRVHNASISQIANSRAMGMLDAVRLMNEVYAKAERYDEFQKYYVPYKMHLLHHAWTRLPKEMRAEYIGKIAELYLPGDVDYFERDDLSSMFPFLEAEKVEFARASLRGEQPSKVKKKRKSKRQSGGENTNWSTAKPADQRLKKRISRRLKQKAPGLVRFVKRVP